METNVLMQSKDRVLSGVNISVMPKDGYICLTDATKALNEKRLKKGLMPKKVNDIMSTLAFRERIIDLSNELINNELWRSINIRLQESSLIISSLHDLKKLGLAYRKGKREDQKWFVEPYVFSMIALEMDSAFYAKVIVWLNDGLIQIRNDAGDSYKKMCSSIDKLIPRNERVDRFKEVARAINHIVFNYHEEGIRNKASLKELSDITFLENSIYSIINNELILDFESLISYLRREWKSRWGNKIISIE